METGPETQKVREQMVYLYIYIYIVEVVNLFNVFNVFGVLKFVVGWLAFSTLIIYWRRPFNQVNLFPNQ